MEGPREARQAARAPRCGLPDSTCCPGPPGGGARAKSRRPGNDAQNKKKKKRARQDNEFQQMSDKMSDQKSSSLSTIETPRN